MLTPQVVVCSCLVFWQGKLVYSHPKLWYVPTPSCGMLTPHTATFLPQAVVCLHPKLLYVPVWYFATPNCGRFLLDILPPEDVVCSHPKLWYVYTTNCGIFLFGILPSQIGVCSCLVCFHSELWYVPTPSCGVFPPNCGMFPSCDIFFSLFHAFGILWPSLWCVHISGIWCVPMPNWGMCPPHTVVIVCSHPILVCSHPNW